MKTRFIATGLATAIGLPVNVIAVELPPSITTPDKVETRIGTLEYRGRRAERGDRRRSL